MGVERGTLTELRSQAFEGLAQRVAAGGATVEPTPTSAPPQTARQEATANGDVLAALVDGGFLTIDRMGGDEFDVATFPGEGALALLLTDTGAKVSPGIFTPLIRAAADAPLLTLVADLTTPPDDDEEAPDPPIVAVRDDDDLTQRISTLDDATSAAGRIAVVLALEELQSGEVGHYGHGAGAARTIPEPPQG
ncbi:MAG: copper transporter [Actinobacteria bacterium]|nr:copper transporter [Actinomycetota bacterium]